MLASLAAGVQRGMVMTPFDVHLSYLPLAHIFERQVRVRVVPEESIGELTWPSRHMSGAWRMSL